MGAILEIKGCVERRIGYAISFTPPTGINSTVTTDWTHQLGEVTRTSELNQVKLFLIGTILQQICVYLPNSCLWTYVSNDANDAGFQFINFFPHKKALTNVFHREYWDPDHEAKSRPTSQCRFCNQPLFCTIVSLVTRYIHAKLNCADINQRGNSGTYKYKIIHV